MITKNCALFKKSLSAVALSLAFQSPYALAMENADQKLNNQTGSVSVWNKTPNEVLAKFCLYSNDNSLLSLRVVDVNTSQIVDDEFRRRAAIKTPLACLTILDGEHPTPHTMSYFVRKRLGEIPKILSKGYERSVLRIYQDCAKFCEERNYPAKSLMAYIGKINTWGVNFEIEPWYSSLREIGTRDSQELLLWIMSNFSHLSENLNDPKTFDNIMKDLINNNGKDIALYYTKLAAEILLNKRKTEDSKHYLKIAADYGDEQAAFELGVIFTKLGDLEQAKIYYLMAANKGDANGQLNLGVLLYKEGNLEQAIKFIQMAADQNDHTAIENLKILKQKQMIKDLSDLASPLLINVKDERDKNQILDVLFNIDQEDRQDVINNAKLLVDRLTDNKNIGQIIYAVANLKKEDRKDVIHSILHLVNGLLDNDGIQNLIRNISGIEPGDRVDIVKNTLPLIQDTMDTYDRRKIIEYIQQIEKDDRKDVVDNVLLLSQGLGIKSHLDSMIYAIKDITKEKRSAVIKNVLYFNNKVLNLTEEFLNSQSINEIIKEISEINQEDLDNVIDNILPLIKHVGNTLPYHSIISAVTNVIPEERYDVVQNSIPVLLDYPILLDFDYKFSPYSVIIDIAETQKEDRTDVIEKSLHLTKFIKEIKDDQWKKKDRYYDRYDDVYRSIVVSMRNIAKEDRLNVIELAKPFIQYTDYPVDLIEEIRKVEDKDRVYVINEAQKSCNNDYSQMPDNIKAIGKITQEDQADVLEKSQYLNNIFNNLSIKNSSKHRLKLSKIIQAIGKTEREDREDVIRCIQSLLNTGKFNKEKISDVIDIIRKIDANDRESAIEHADALIRSYLQDNPQSDYPLFIKMCGDGTTINIFSDFSKENHQRVVDLLLTLKNEDKEKYESFLLESFFHEKCIGYLMKNDPILKEDKLSQLKNKIDSPAVHRYILENFKRLGLKKSDSIVQEAHEIWLSDPNHTTFYTFLDWNYFAGYSIFDPIAISSGKVITGKNFSK